MILAIIPARGGSRRIPRKNIRDFRGKPIIQWSIEMALASGLFDEVMVSTDDDEIGDVAQSAGAVVPFMRSRETSDDYATTVDVLLEVLDGYRSRGTSVETACCIYATAPFIRAEDLEEGLLTMQAGGFDGVFSVARFEYPIWRSLERDERGQVRFNFPENVDVRSQDLPASYHDAGQWYWFRATALRRDHSLMGPNVGSIVLPVSRVQDIDTEEDWGLAELKHRDIYG